MKYKKNNKLINCLYCRGTKVQKNGLLDQGGQRWKCIACHKQFSTGGIRGTYGKDFRNKIIESYCHQNHTARKLANEMGLSTSTIISRAKDHKNGCNICNK